MGTPAETERNAQIVKEHKDGAGYSELARKYGLSRQRIYAICRRAAAAAREAA